ncbi:hypothetical protein ACFL7M_12520 [Thermodesulfobacteriota bacterium]
MQFNAIIEKDEYGCLKALLFTDPDLSSMIRKKYLLATLAPSRFKL